MNTKIEKYYSLLKEQKLIKGSSGLLSWDQEAVMPEKNVEFRADQISYLNTLLHSKRTSTEFINLVEDLSGKVDNLDPIDKRSVENTKRDIDKVKKLSQNFVETFSKAKSVAQSAWRKAKEGNDFSLFKPHLQTIIDLTKQYAELINPNKPTYDVLLDDFEEDLTTEEVSNIFTPLKDELITLLANVKQDEDHPNIFKNIDFNADKAEHVVRELVSKIGFDFTSGALGRVHHPFETSLSPYDIRINQSYYHKDLAQTLTGAIHELGHGLYEQNIDEKYFKTSLNQGVSLGVHESQSRLLENMIGRSKAFWDYFKPLIHTYFPKAKDISTEEIIHQLTFVQPSFIRIEADEVTYNLHIILRFEIEQEMLKPDFNIDDLPEIWNAKMQDFLGIIPPEISKGCLQDVHWSLGAIGYFPTYSLGNLIAGQLWNVFTKQNPDYNSNISSGDFSFYFNWFKENIWQHGSFYKAKDLIKHVTGEELDSKYLVAYLKDKYLQNYTK